MLDFSVDLVGVSGFLIFLGLLISSSPSPIQIIGFVFWIFTSPVWVFWILLIFLGFVGGGEFFQEGFSLC